MMDREEGGGEEGRRKDGSKSDIKQAGSLLG